jgi:hypothetical protein
MFGWFKSKRKKEYIGTRKMISQYFDVWSGETSKERHVECACYKEFNSETNEIYSVYTTYHGKKYYFNPDVYVKEGRLITL